MTVDNFDLFRGKLDFQKATKFDSAAGKFVEINDTYDRYIVQILRRAKDPDGKSQGVNTGNRLIKTYEISSVEYFDKKRPHIVDLCRSNRARAYILPQVRSTYDCLKEMIRIGIDNLENPTVKFQHVLRSSLCSMHKSRAKRWILDLDADCMVERWVEVNFGGQSLRERTWTPEKVMYLVRDSLSEIGGNPDDAYFVPTKSGTHIVTPPFNVAAVSEKCGLVFEGEKKMPVSSESYSLKPGDPGYAGSIGLDSKYKVKYEKKTGWLHKDGMSLLYYTDEA